MPFSVDSVKNATELFLTAGSLRFVSDDATIEFAGNPTVLQSFKTILFEGEIIQQKTVRINAYQKELALFVDASDFQMRVKEEDFRSDILIISTKKGAYFFEATSKETQVAFTLVKNEFLVSNVYYYFAFLRFLSTKEHKEDQLFYFIDYFNWDNREIVLTSLSKEGKLTIPFPQQPPVLPENVNIGPKVKRFQSSFDDKQVHLPKFIKAEFFNFLSKEPRANRINLLFAKLDEILLAASQNHEIYVSELNLVNVKKDYIEHRDKYFQSIRDIVGKISTQIIGLPLSITATAFATYKIADVQVLALVLIVFVVYSVFAFFALRFHRHDIAEIALNAREEFKRLKSSSFFLKFPDEIVVFEKINDRIRAKISTLADFINIYFFALLLTNAVFAEFIFEQVSAKLHYIVLISMMALGLLYWFFVVRKLNDRLELVDKNEK